jgi:hypothetical protein
LKAKLLSFFVIVTGVILVQGLNAHAYDKDIHYYLTYYIAQRVGFTDEQAYQLAASDQYVDEHPDTLPTGWPTQAGAEQRRLYHFPKWDSTYSPDTLRNSFFGRFDVLSALNDSASSDPVVRSRSWFRMGLSLHVFQDTYAHEGYGYSIGHAAAGHDPDRPYLDALNINKSLEVAAATYWWLVDFYRAVYQEDPPGGNLWPSIQQFIEPLIMTQYDWWDYTWYDDEIEARCNFWFSALQKAGFGNQAFSRAVYEDPSGKNYKPSFETAISWHCVPHISAAATVALPAPRAHAEAVSMSMAAPLFSDACSIVQAKTNWNSVRLADYIATKAPWALDADCVLTHLGYKAALRRLAQRLQSGDDPYIIYTILIRAHADPALKTKILTPLMNSSNPRARFMAADLIYQLDNNSAAAVKVLTRSYWAAANAGNRFSVLGFIPPTDDFLPVLQDALHNGPLPQQVKAADTLFQAQTPACSSVLQSYALEHLTDSSMVPDLAYWLLLGLSRNTDFESAPAPANRALLLQLLNKHGTDPAWVNPCVAALRTQWSPGDSEIAQAIVNACSIPDSPTQWEAGYSLGIISGTSFDLSSKGIGSLPLAATTWYNSNF